MRRRVNILVDDLGIPAVLKLFLFALRYRVLAVRFITARSKGIRAVRLMQAIRLVRRCDPIDLDLTAPAREPGPLRERLHMLVHDTAMKLAERIRSTPCFIDFAPTGISPARKQAYLEKILRRDIYDACILACVHAQCESVVSPESSGQRNARYVSTIAIVGLADLAGQIDGLLAGETGILFRGYTPPRLSIVVRFGRFIAGQADGFLAPLTRRGPRDLPATRQPTVATQYAQGIDGKLFTDSDIWWYDHAELPSDRCLLLFERPGSPATDETIRALKSRGLRFRILRPAANATSDVRTDGFPAKGFRHAIDDSLSCLGLSWAAFGAPAPRWQVSEWLRLMKGVRQWQAVMVEEGIRVIFSTEQASVDTMSLAADLEDGIRAGFHWWAANYPVQTRSTLLHHVFFVWGPQHLIDATQTLAGCPEFVLESGCIFDDVAANPDLDEAACNSRSRFAAAGVKHVIGVLDRSLGVRGACPAHRHARFFDALLSLAEGSESIGLLVKPKAVGGPEILALEAQLAARMTALQREGRAIVLHGKQYVAEAAKAADVSVALGYNSAGFVAALAGGRCVFWDPAKLTGGPYKSWYIDLGWGAPQVVFHDMDVLIRQLESFLESPDDSPGFGDASSLLARMDTFRDGRAAERIGGFVGDFIRELGQGNNRDAALEIAVDAYRIEWGRNAVLRPAAGDPV